MAYIKIFPIKVTVKKAISYITNPDKTDEKLSVEQESALNKAEEYLNMMAFSHDSLIDQLKFEGFSEEDATYAAENCGADWQEQADKKAKEYLDTMAFSHDSLIKQLEHEKFSNKDATHAADNCGADWNEQAAKKAKEYRNTGSFSHKQLVSQLEFEGFTSEQAEYGVSQGEWHNT